MKNSRNFLGAKWWSSIKDAWRVREDGQDLLVTETDPVIFFFFETGLYVT